MDNEILILTNLGSHTGLSQREIASNTGISLGNVNKLIRCLVMKGLLKIEKINSKVVKYILTPEGHRERNKVVYNCTIRSYKTIDSINIKIDSIFVNELYSSCNCIVLFSSKDEIHDIFVLKLKSRNTTYYVVNQLIDIDNLKNTIDDMVIIAWHPDYIRQLLDNDIEHINLLENL